MNLQGIKFLRELKLPAPLKEVIVKNVEDVDLDWMYDGATKGVTIMTFDPNEPIDQTPLLEKYVYRYGIKREDYFKTAQELVSKLNAKSVNRIEFVVHQSYFPEDIAYSGRVAIHLHHGFGVLLIEIVESMRKAKTDFTPALIYEFPIVGGKVIKSQSKIIKKDLEFPEKYLSKLLWDIVQIPGNPNLDFGIYNDGKLFYHDMFLAK